MIRIDWNFIWPVALLLVLTSACSAGGQEADMSYGVPVFPDAEPMPEVAAAVEAFYRPGVPHDQRIETAVFETPAEFEEVYQFYGPRMEPGKWGWRRKSYALQHQTQTLRFMRANMVNGEVERGEAAESEAPATAESLEPLEPLFGESELSTEEFDARLGRLNEKYPEAKIEIAEGSRPIDGVDGQVRITIERPYLDLGRMELVDRTRIVLVKVTERG